MIRRLATNLALAIVATLVVLAGCELFLRAFRPQPLEGRLWAQTRDGLIVHEWGADAYLPAFDRHVRINAHGMRDREHPLAKPAGVYRVVLLGDSFTEGFQVDGEDLLARRLETALATRSGRRVEVVNAGVSGWGTDDQLTWLRRYGLAFEPDLVLVALTLHNDVKDNLRRRFHTWEDGELVERPRVDVPWLRYQVSRAKAACTARLHLCSLVYQATRTRQVRGAAKALDSHAVDLFRTDEDPALAEAWLLTRALLDEIRRTAAEVGAETAALLIPLFYQVDDRDYGLFLKQRGVAADDAARGRPQDRVLAWGAQTGAPVIDLLPEFRRVTLDEELYIHRDGHWNAAGHALAAEIAARELAARGVVP